MKILVTGASGRLAKEFIKISNQKNIKLFPFSREELDISNPSQLRSVFKKILPNAVVNFAAYTNVDLAEKINRELSINANINGPSLLSSMCSEYNSKLCHISTSFVFDGQKPLSDSYSEKDATFPINEYGKDKLIGENLIKQNMNNYFIIRTNWLFGSTNDFLVKMISLARENKKISAISNQYGSFTSIKDLSSFCLDIIDTDQFGVYNYANRGFATPFEFISFALKKLDIDADIQPVADDEFNFIAKRQRNLCLNTDKAIKIQGNINNWEFSLQNFLEEFYNDKEKFN